MALIKVLYCDIDGVILPKDPPQDLPYMQRLDYIKKEVNKIRLKLGYQELKEFSRDDFIWNNESTTDLNWICQLLTQNPFSNAFDITLNSQSEYVREIIENAKRIITDSVDYYFKLVKEQEKRGIKLEYTPNPGIRRFLEEAKKAGISLYIVSGNPKKLAEDKLKRAGLLDFFLINNKLPDWPIYGEDILSRKEAIEIIRDKTILPLPYDKERVIQETYMCDRPSDLNVFYGYTGSQWASKILFFNNRLKDTDAISYTYGRFPIAEGYLRELEANNRILYLPNGLDSIQIVNQALNFIGCLGMNRSIESNSPKRSSERK